MQFTMTVCELKNYLKIYIFNISVIFRLGLCLLVFIISMVCIVASFQTQKQGIVDPMLSIWGQQMFVNEDTDQ